MRRNYPKLYLFLVALLLGFWPLSLMAGKELTIAMVLWRGETPAEKGLKETLQQLGYKVVYDQFDAGQDVEKLGKMLKRISVSADSYDYIYTFGTTVSRRARVVVNGRIPQVFNVVTDPVGAGVISEENGGGANISGVSDTLPVTDLFEAVESLFTFKKLGIFFNPREKNSLISRNQIYKIAKSRGFEVVDFRSPPVERELQKNLEKLRDNPGIVDAVYFPSDSFLVSNAELIARQLISVKVLSLGAARKYIEKGLLFGIGVEYHSLGKAAAVIIDRNQKGEKLRDIPFGKAQKASYYFNETTGNILGISLNTDVLREVIVVQ